jgi:HPt (histidine-containing phosphotransfer) domain-containing protein
VPTAYHEFNPEETLHRLDHDLEFLQEMVAMLPEQTVDGMQRLEAALQQQEAVELKEAAHRFKGSVAILSTGRLYDLLRQIEVAEDAERLQTGAALLPEVSVAIVALSRELEHYLQSQCSPAEDAGANLEVIQ